MGYIPSPEDLPNPGIEPESPTLQVDSLPSEPPGKLGNKSSSDTSLVSKLLRAEMGIGCIQGQRRVMPGHNAELSEHQSPYLPQPVHMLTTGKKLQILVQHRL